MRDIASHTLSICQNKQNVVNLALHGADFQQERAIITMEIYKKDGLWRFAALASGFNGGLGDLLSGFLNLLFGGFGRVRHDRVSAFVPGVEGSCMRLYLPARTATVLCPVE